MFKRKPRFIKRKLDLSHHMMFDFGYLMQQGNWTLRRHIEHMNNEIPALIGIKNTSLLSDFYDYEDFVE